MFSLCHKPAGLHSREAASLGSRSQGRNEFRNDQTNDEPLNKESDIGCDIVRLMHISTKHNPYNEWQDIQSAPHVWNRHVIKKEFAKRTFVADQKTKTNAPRTNAPAK
ncbi:MAG TPA: hypothetical protein DC054_20545 [Blastocatellia bacterium]|nr:hypothetical protein [Blastocatellia bacterium]